MGNGRAVEYVTLINSDLQRKFVISVSPNSMAPKDEVAEQNLAIELYNAHALDPITLFKKLNFPDPMETAKMVALWTTNPQAYVAQFFPEQAQMMPQPGAPIVPERHHRRNRHRGLRISGRLTGSGQCAVADHGTAVYPARARRRRAAGIHLRYPWGQLFGHCCQQCTYAR